MSAVMALEPVRRPAPLGRFRRHRWHLIGDQTHPVARELRARSASPGMSQEASCGTAVLLGGEFGWEDNARLLDGLAAARRDGGRLALLHLGAGGASLLRVAAAEDPRLRVVSIELPPATSARASRVAVTVANSDPIADTELAVDDAGRVSRTAWRPVSLPDRDGSGSREPRSVLITGGLGGLGLRAANVVARVHNLHPVLIDNACPDALSSDAAAHLRRLRAGPSGVTVLNVDITDSSSTVAALSTVDTPPIRVVLHCAGILTGGPLRDVTSAELLAAQQVKVGGLGNVLAGLDRDQLSNLVTFGSVTAERPHRGLGCYALANELLRRATLRMAPNLAGCATVAAEWSLWSGAGMAAKMGAVAQARRMGMTPVSLRAGMTALLRLLAWPQGPDSAVSLLLSGAALPRLSATRS